MKFFFFSALLFFSTLSHEITMELMIPSELESVLVSYRNGNYSQEIDIQGEEAFIRIWSRNFFDLGLVDRISPNFAYLDSRPAEIRETFQKISRNCIFLKDFMKSLSNYLENRIAYSEEEAPDEPQEVIRKGKADCIGFSNLAMEFLRCAGIPCRLARGFYLKVNGGQEVVPVSHRWLEITIAGNHLFFYDPQYQSFSGFYLLAKSDIDFTQVKRFHARLLKKNKRLNYY